MYKIWVAPEAINSNVNGGNQPSIVIKADDQIRYVYGVEILGPSKFVTNFSIERPHIWIETESEIIMKAAPLSFASELQKPAVVKPTSQDVKQTDKKKPCNCRRSNKQGNLS